MNDRLKITGLFGTEDSDAWVSLTVEGHEVDWRILADMVRYIGHGIVQKDINEGYSDDHPETIESFLLPLEFFDLEYDNYDPPEDFA